MQVQVTQSLDEWYDAVEPFLTSDPVVHTLPLSVAAGLRVGVSWSDQPPWFAAIIEAGVVVGAACRTPPLLLIATDMPTAAAEALGGEIPADVPGAVARPDVAAAIAAGAGRPARFTVRELHYRLDRLVDPPGVAGSARATTPEDEDLVIAWTAAFEKEIGLFHVADPQESLRRRRARGDTLWLWCVDGEPVSMAGYVAPVCGVPRVGPVYTPEQQRGRGYGAAVTAAVCADAFARGATACTLFADAANPASNAVYRRLGFVVVREATEALFDDVATG